MNAIVPRSPYKMVCVLQNHVCSLFSFIGIAAGGLFMSVDGFFVAACLLNSVESCPSCCASVICCGWNLVIEHKISLRIRGQRGRNGMM